MACLEYDKKDNDWLNQQQPCQFLNLKSNMCSIYEVRPADCAGFPHLTKKKFTEYIHVHKQNVELCPATYKMFEKMKRLEKAMHDSAKNLEFEKAADFRDQLKKLKEKFYGANVDDLSP